MTNPWDERRIYLHENHKNQPDVGKFISYMDGMGMYNCHDHIIV